MIVRIHRLLSRISYLQCQHVTLSKFAKMAGLPRSTLTKLAGGNDVNISTRTLEKIVTAAFFEIRKALPDRDRLSDAKIRELVLGELINHSRNTYLATKRQANEASKAAIEQFLDLDLPDCEEQ